MSATQPPAEQRRIDEFVTDDDEKCAAISVSTSERCQRDALAGVEYCAIHLPREEPDDSLL
jgi:hypothetical protein